MQPKLGYNVYCSECNTEYEVWIRDDDLAPDICSFCGAGLEGSDVVPSEQTDAEDE